MEISARTAAVMASEVYGMNRKISAERLVAVINDDIGGGLELPSTTLKGKYGIGAAKVDSHGGLFILGKDKYKGDAFLIFRGTQLRIDWGTNIDIGTKAIGSGLVHAGFYKALGSMKDQIRQFVVTAQAAGIVRFHCIGHSLGGAIAILCGDWLKSSFKINPYVYTFGAPRPGLQNFAKHLSRTFNQDRVFRVHHTGDIVPLIAPWPFVHAPDVRKSCRIEKGGFIPNVASHDRFLYIKSVSDDKGGAIPWKALNKVNERPFSEREIEAWMLMKHERTAVGFTLAFMERVSAAVRHLTVNVLKGLVGGLTMGISSAFTWYDFLAYIFKKGLVATGRVAELIFGLMNKMLRAMGMSVIADVNELTRDKIRHVFLTFNARINHLVYQAVNSTLAGGKAV